MIQITRISTALSRLKNGHIFVFIALYSKWFIPTQERLNYSCRFLSFLDQDVVKPMFFDSYEEAYASVVRAEHWGVIHIMEDYSLALKKRVTGMGDLALAQFTGFTGTKVFMK